MDENAQPLVRVVNGHPTDAELAALTSVIAAKLAQSEPGGNGSAPRVSTWADYWRSIRAPLRPGPGAWRASALPTSP